MLRATMQAEEEEIACGCCLPVVVVSLDINVSCCHCRTHTEVLYKHVDATRFSHSRSLLPPQTPDINLGLLDVVVVVLIAVVVV